MSQKFTYGFEIEGAFAIPFLNKLVKDRRKLKITDFHRKHDGSVDVYSAVPVGTKWNDNVQELAIGIFNNFKDLLNVLELFKNNENYWENGTCGLHIHIKPLNETLRTKIGDYDFIHKLQNWAEKNLCQHITDRIKGKEGNYCQPYQESFSDTYYNWEHHQKYIFLGNHPYINTFEFRFFSTCKEKESNVKKFFKYFFKELDKVEAGKKEIITLPKIILATEKEMEFAYQVRGSQSRSVKLQTSVFLPRFSPPNQVKRRKDLFEIGDKVIYVSGRHGDYEHNPLWNGNYGKVVGTIIKTDIDSDLSIRVKWKENIDNTYAPKDLNHFGDEDTELKKELKELKELKKLYFNLSSNL